MSYVPAASRYESMPYRRAGRSGLLLPRISLGLWQNFGEDRSPATQASIVRRAFDLGVTHIDLANNYGPPPGAAESVFGRILAKDLAGHRDELVISTKAGWRMWPGPYGEFGSRKYLLASLDQSLARLGVDYVDIFYSHRPDPGTPMEEVMGALASAVRQGKALYAGISSYSSAQTRQAVEAMRAFDVPILIHQPRYSMFDRRIEDDGLLDALGELGIGSIVYSPLAQGLLTDRYLDGTAPAGSRMAGQLAQTGPVERYLARARALDAIARQRGQTLAQLALTWVLRDPRVTSALIGASSVAQLEQNLEAADAPELTAGELAAIEPHAVDGTEFAR